LEEQFNHHGPYAIRQNYLFLDGRGVGEMWLTPGGGYTGPPNFRVVEVQKISIDGPLQHRGHARAAMTQLLRMADAHDLTIKLEPVDYMGASKPQLVAFYASLGFVKYAGRNLMRRKPHARLTSATG
jgi:hypothetical protein